MVYLGVFEFRRNYFMPIFSPNISAVLGASGIGKTQFLFSKMMQGVESPVTDKMHLYITDEGTPHQLKKRYNTEHKEFVQSDTNIISFVQDEHKMNYVLCAVDRLVKQGKELVIYTDLMDSAYLKLFVDKITLLIEEGYEHNLEVIFAVQTAEKIFTLPYITPQTIAIADLNVAKENLIVLS